MAVSVLIRVLFFGTLKDAAGTAEDCLDAPEGWRVADVYRHYSSLHPGMRALEDSTAAARNREFCRMSAPVAEGDEIAFLPPVSGGAGSYAAELEGEEGHFFALTREPIDVPELAARVTRGADGAVVAFEGIVRDNTGGRPVLYLDYEAYEPMALKIMAEIGREIARAPGVGRIAVVHRLGRVRTGETALAVLVSAPHRKPAFEAAAEVVDSLKRRVPIWKKEYFADGEVWADGEWDHRIRGL